MCACVISGYDKFKKKKKRESGKSVCMYIGEGECKDNVEDNDIFCGKTERRTEQLTPSQKVINKSTDPLGVCGEGNRTVLMFSHCTLAYL